MAEIRTRLVIRNDLAATWLSIDPVLYRGEIGIEIDTNKIKIGDGSRKWSELPYFVSSDDPVADEILTRVSTLEGKVVTIEGQLGSIQGTLEEQGGKISTLEGSVAEFLAKLADKADASVVEELAGKVAGLEGLGAILGSQPEADTRSVFERLAANDQAIVDLNGQISGINGQIEGLGTQISGLDGRISGVEGRVKGVEDEIVVLKGTGEGSISKTVNDAIDAWAQKVSDDETLNTFKEIIDYVADHKGEATQIMADIEGLKAKDTALEGQIAGLNSALANKVEKKEGYDLVSNALIAKLEGLNENAEANYVKSVDEEFFGVDEAGHLTLKDLPQSKISGLTEALASAGQLNGIQINGTDLVVADKKVNIQFSEDFSYADNKVALNKVNVNKLYVEESDELILNGGNA